MKRIFQRLLCCLLALTLLPVLPAAAADDDEPCIVPKVSVLLVPRAGEALADAAARAGAAVDDFALTAAGAAVLAAADARLDAMTALAADVCHCFAVDGRYRAAALGLAVTVDLTDLPALAAAGDLAGADAAFDWHLLTAYEALDVEETDETSAVVLPAVSAVDRHAGAGCVIAVLDTGFSLDEPYFTLPDGISPALAGDALTERLALVGRTSAAQSGKIPFAFNYAVPGGAMDTLAAHGTEVAALAAACTAGFDGGAPAAQLLCMKVFGDDAAAPAEEQALLAAIDDALLLGADVINLSLGLPDGGKEGGVGLSRALAGAEAAGVSVVCAAGNTGESGEGSIFIGTTGRNLYPTAHIDRGTIAAPASYAGSFAVGSAIGSYLGSTVLRDAEGREITYSDTCTDYFADPEYAGMSADFLRLIQHALEGGSFTYVTVPGIGAAEDYAGLDLAGRVALVERGTISFVEKTQHAAAAGAIAVIVRDNDPETDGAINMELTGAVLPAVIIGIADGRRLAASAQGELAFPDERLSQRGQYAFGVSGFSSRGMRDDFTLAPALVAPGQNYLGLTVDQRFTLLTGTSYAAAQTAGAAAALIARVRAEGLADGPNAAAMAEQLLQNTAIPFVGADGIPISVRSQGAGLINAAAALRTPLALSGSDGGAVTMTGAERSFALTFRVRNLTDHAQTFTLTPAAWADDYARPDLSGEGNRDYVDRLLAAYGWDELPLCTTGRLRALPDTVFSFDGARIGEGGLALTLAAGEVRTLTVEVSLADADADAYAEAFPNGFAVEGRFALRVEDGDAHHVLTLPWAVFCGDRADTPIAPVLAYDEGEQLYYGQVMTVRTITGDTIKLGVLPESAEDVAPYSDIRLAAFNPNFCTGSVTLNLCLLRRVSHWSVEVTDEAGEVVSTGTGGVLNRTWGVNALARSESIPLWNGRAGDNANYVCPDGLYTVTLTLYGSAGGEQVLTIPLRIDTTPPELVSADFRRSGEGKLMLDLVLRDNGYLRAVEISDRWEYGRFTEGVMAPDAVLAAGEGAERVLTTEGAIYGEVYLYVALEDVAGNVRTFRLNRGDMFDAFMRSGG